MQRTRPNDGNQSRDEPAPLQRFAVLPPIATAAGTNYVTSAPYSIPPPVATPMFPFLYPPMIPFQGLQMYPSYPMAPQYHMPYSVAMELPRQPQSIEPQHQMVVGIATLPREDPAHLVGVARELCEELVGSTVGELVTEAVHACFEDIAREYLAQVHLLRPPSIPLSPSGSNQPAQSYLRTSTPSHLHPSPLLLSTASHPHQSPLTPTPTPLAHMKSRERSTHHLLSQANTPTELCRYACSMLLEELMLEQLLMAAASGQSEAIAATITSQRETLLCEEAERILQGLIFEQLGQWLVKQQQQSSLS